ncbi:bifunctional 3-dehydroquinate dehydratase/shikimate dehydrogenase, chloroplastic isoform X2 [Hevea brasiliensis]|uniref:bifunctional 3-dehydroquinate dehydratase/shikimate dehydrogenase, chloroplastic isoform X2 n=1 Tax=Hevea brasiliensis TaxID=3981 RepID=UPI0025D430A2|nr:bifunctional 3-dehydroquinate dehydratase/shikimate dehydrogenase, chloroplastic isoform X2 [Hevea brasiliensis]
MAFHFQNNVLVCSPLECETAGEMLSSMEKARAEGADLVELRIDSMTFSHISQVHKLIQLRTLPAIVSFRPYSWKNSSSGDSNINTCLQVMRLAIDLNVEFVEMDYESTGADVVKLVINVHYITDLASVFKMLAHCQVPLIALAVGSRGLLSQLLGPKFGGFLVYGSLGDKTIPGMPTLFSLRHVYKLEYINAETKVFGLISNPVGHSKGPILHNPAFRHTGYNGIYVPMQVDDIKEFFRTFTSTDFAGFSVGIPHKEAAVGCCDEVHPLAKSIGAVNTIVRRPTDGKLVGYNTDCEASISAIEDALRERRATNRGASDASPLAGKTLVLVGAGGAGRALAFGAKSRGAQVFIFNRNYERAKALAHAVAGKALPYENLERFRTENVMILANASAVGMEPNSDQTPVSKESLKAYELVFDAVYTPINTRLLQEAKEVGAIVVSGVEMFIRQALGQFRLFTGGLAPEAFMRKLVLEQF